MTDPDKETLDRETREAVDALVRRLRDKGDADDEPFAAEYVAFLRGCGWRPVLAVPASADWRRRPAGSTGAGLDPDVKAELLGRFQEASDTIRNRATGGQQALTPDREWEFLREGPDP